MLGKIKCKYRCIFYGYEQVPFYHGSDAGCDEQDIKVCRVYKNLEKLLNKYKLIP